MADVTRITGVDSVIRKMRKSKKMTGKALEAGLKRGGLYVQRESQKVVPIDLGNLKNSAFTRAFRSGLRTVVVVGYTAFYAVYVHEDLKARHRPGKRNKYLEHPIREKRDRILKIIAQGRGVV